MTIAPTGPTETAGLFGSLAPTAPAAVSHRDASSAWAASGLDRLSDPKGLAGSPIPARTVRRLDVVAAELTEATAAFGSPVEVEPLSLLAARVRSVGGEHAGTVSVSGGCRLLATLDGWLAVNLARGTDRDLIPAWLGSDEWNAPRDDQELWSALGAELGRRSSRTLLAVGRELGLAVAEPAEAGGRSAVVASRSGPGWGPPTVGRPRVVNLGSLWAAPLAGHLLHRAGADVTDVEFASRPDPLRVTAPTFHRTLHRGHGSVVVDVTTSLGRAHLRRLLTSADIVITASRPRALAQLGCAPADLGAARPRIWCAVTGHGTAASAAGWVAFGDDAAVAGGLMTWSAGRPAFVGDAAADPVTGLVAAAAVARAWLTGGGWDLDVALAHCAAAMVAPQDAMVDHDDADG